MAGTARFGSPGIGRPGYTLSFNANATVYLTDKITHQFRSGPFQVALTKVNERLAIAVQQGMVERLEEKVRGTGRNQKPGNRWLAHSLLDEKNRAVTANVISVGRPSWLERSPAALYYRRIEEGDKQSFWTQALFTNGLGASGRRTLVGPWSEGGGTRAMPSGYKHARMPQHIGPRVRISGYPAYRYTEGGVAAYNRFDLKGAYATELQAHGISLSGVFRTSKK